ncbi:hypothetical protein V5799_027446 [Amblyomma americanum]|uniref:Uncharacterized protein n=1 Tax=Amblyomma americanum TaxID=6943 RepID=A0AAQ4DFP4_AMBAM
MFRGVSCDACGQRDIVGTRWKCAACFNYDLCTTCHYGGKHSLDHAFLYIKVPGGTAIMVPPRRGIVRAEVKWWPQEKIAALYRSEVSRTKVSLFTESTATAVANGALSEHAGSATSALTTTCAPPATWPTRTASTTSSGASTCPVRKGIIFPGVNCDGCNKHDIVGPRWKCTSCIDYDLCTACYMAKKHNFDHIFLRFDSPRSKVVKVSPRQESLRAEDTRVSKKAVLFHGIYCDSCDERDIVGPLWKCDSCGNYDLCTTCYMAGVHDLDHGFLRFDAPASRGHKVFPRIRSVLSGEVLDDSETARREQRAVKFMGINCDGCGQRGIVGTRWKCAVCFDYDLCSACYRGDKHHLDHAFLRFDEIGSAGVYVFPREASRSARTEATSGEGEETWEDRQNEEREGPDGDNEAPREELLAKLRELEEAVQCVICMDRLHNVAFTCGHRACADCAENLEVCHICRKKIAMKITLY